MCVTYRGLILYLSLPLLEYGSRGLNLREEVYVLPFDAVPGPVLPKWLESQWVVGPLIQAHSSGPAWVRPYYRLFAR